MRDYFVGLVLYVNKFFPEKKHPFNIKKNWVLDLNYTDYEYDNTKELLNQYKPFFDLNKFRWKKVLDLWCWGWGKSIYIAEKYDCEVIWIDLNLNFLKQANLKIKELNLENKVSYMQESALGMNFSDSSFDIIIMSDVLEHIPNTELLFNEIHRVLKKWWYILFDFAPYYHYFWHHIWDTIKIPWLHLLTTDYFIVLLYKRSLVWLADSDKRLDLRIWLDKDKKESFTYLNKISRKKFEKILEKNIGNFEKNRVKYFMIKNLDFLSYLPFFREVFIRHIVWVLKK